jgi:hypothetical protein
MKNKKCFQHVTIVESLYHTTRSDYTSSLYEIEVDDDRITDIHRDTALHLYKELGKVLGLEKGGAS